MQGKMCWKVMKRRVFSILSENQAIPHWLESRKTGNNILLSLGNELDDRNSLFSLSFFFFLMGNGKDWKLTVVSHSKRAETCLQDRIAYLAPAFCALRQILNVSAFQFFIIIIIIIIILPQVIFAVKMR